ERGRHGEQRVGAWTGTSRVASAHLLLAPPRAHRDRVAPGSRALPGRPAHGNRGRAAMTTNRTRILLRWAARATRLATLALLLAAAPSVAALEVHHVPGDFATLQAALDAAAPGDTVVIDGGEHLYTRISKPVTLVGRASNVPYLTVASGGPPG